MQQKTYLRLQDCEREAISRGIVLGHTLDTIGKDLGRHTSTISREIARNSGKSRYRAFSAKRRAYHASSVRRRGKSRLAQEIRLRNVVIAGLRKCWSPREIVIRMTKEYPLDMTMRISHEAIYRYIYVLPRGSLKATLVKGLRQEHAYRRKKKVGVHDEQRGKIADMLSIEERPKEVEDRSVPGHWEGDLIIGKYKRSAIGTLVERTTRYVILVPLKAKDATSVREAYAREFQKLPKEITKTLTYDQGKEMSEHKQFTIDTGIQVYFAHPGSPWERGTNENTNGLIRQYFPKGTEFDKIPVRELKRVQRQLNDRPRAVLNYMKPDEVINQLVALKV
ncbi:MAG: IS30 family transposase [Patescibacteria group bacterium]